MLLVDCGACGHKISGARGVIYLETFLMLHSGYFFLGTALETTSDIFYRDLSLVDLARRWEMVVWILENGCFDEWIGACWVWDRD